MALKSIARTQVSGWVNTLPSPMPLGPLASATTGGKRRRERSIQIAVVYKAALISGLSVLGQTAQPQCQVSAPAAARAKRMVRESILGKRLFCLKPHHPLPSTYQILQGADKDRHFAYSETGFSSFYPLPCHSLGFVLFWELSKKYEKINTTPTKPPRPSEGSQPPRVPGHTRIRSLSVLPSGRTAGLLAAAG